MDFEKELYTVEEVADMLRLSERTIRRYIAEDKLKAIKILGNVRINRKEIEKLIKPVK